MDGKVGTGDFCVLEQKLKRKSSEARNKLAPVCPLLNLEQRGKPGQGRQSFGCAGELALEIQVRREKNAGKILAGGGRSGSRAGWSYARTLI